MAERLKIGRLIQITQSIRGQKSFVGPFTPYISKLDWKHVDMRRFAHRRRKDTVPGSEIGTKGFFFLSFKLQNFKELKQKLEVEAFQWASWGGRYCSASCVRPNVASDVQRNPFRITSYGCVTVRVGRVHSTTPRWISAAVHLHMNKYEWRKRVSQGGGG